MMKWPSKGGLLLLAAALALLALLAAQAHAAEDFWLQAGPDGRQQVRLYFFWSLTCPHCEAARPFVETIPGRRPWVALQSLEVSRNPENAAFYRDIVSKVGQDAGVPGFLLCGELRIGWHRAETSGAELEQALDACHQRILAGGPAVAGAAPPPPERIELPLIGSVAPESLSLPVLTLALAGMDAFNPCAFFVLLFLLSMLTHQRSRARMLLIGGIFVLCSGVMYFAFMAAWLNIFQLIGHLAWVTAAAGLVAVLVGGLNVKDFFAFKQGPTLSISDSGQADIARRARGLLLADSLPAMLAATVFLAVAANFYELLCTAGFPMVYTRVLTLEEPSAVARYLYLAFYNLIYVTPLAVIVAVFVRTLGARRLTEREGRLLKLLSGLMMLGLGVVLLVAPNLTGNAFVGLGLIAAAVLVTWIAARLTRGKPSGA
jgi:hypothetical protein